MRAFISKLLLTAFIFLFAIPTPLLAQNWVAPAGAPTGNNAPSPINVGPQFQEKVGALSAYGVTSKGFTLFDTNPAPNGSSLFVSLVRSFFANDVDFGVQGTAGTNLNLFGNFRYLPTNPEDGTPGNNQPQPGYALTALDVNGNTGWRPGLPDGVNPGDTLIWDDTCNCWVTGPVTTTTGGTLPPGTIGQTLWYSAPNVLQATDQIKHDTMGGGWTRTTLNNQVTDIKGTQIVYIGNTSTGTTQIGSPETKIIGGDLITLGGNASGPTEINSPSVKFGNDGPNGGYQTVDVKSSNVNFGAPDDGVSQTVTFDTERVKFRDISMNPGTGFLPYSVDDEGQFKWNENLTYQINQGGLFPEPIGQLTLQNPAGGVAVFQNQGISHLLDDVYIDDTGDLYLYGIEAPSPAQSGLGIVKPLCYVTTTKKVVTCDENTITQNPGGFQVEPAYDNDYEILRTFANNSGPQSTYTFQSNQTVNMKFCGAGGAGGGGGAGSINDGGGGGGGGSAGACQTLNDFPVSTGDVLSWNIGDGGSGGLGTRKQTNSSSDYEVLGTAGNAGQPTSLFIDYAIDGPGNPVQVGQTQAGGTGGQRGIGDLLPAPTGGSFDGVTGGYKGGEGANTNLPNWHDGNPGCSNANVGNCVYNPANWNSDGNGANGGSGGDGANEASTDQAPSLNPSSGGNPGTAYISSNCISGVICFQVGANGRDGAYSWGGGGGGGGAGLDPISLDGGVYRWPGGGNGGKGGSGYVKVTGILNSQGASSVVFDTPSSQDVTYSVGAIPLAVQNVTIEVWGGGGGGGGVKTGLFADRDGGGGGGGGYVKVPNVPRATLGTNLLIKVGATGTAGNSSGTGSEVTNGGTGGTSYIKVSGSSTPLVSATGGTGGTKDNDNDSAFATGGSGGGISIIPSLQGLTGIVSAQGTNGSNGSFGTGGNNVPGGSINAGGNGAKSNLTGGLSNSSTSGQAGRVKISW